MFSSEIVRQSAPSILALVRQSILDDTAEGLDAALLDDSAVVLGVRPAGLRNGAPTQASAGATVANVATDIKWLLTRFQEIRARRPVIVLNDLHVASLKMHYDATSGRFPFYGMINDANIFGLPFLASSTVEYGSVIGIDAATLLLARDLPEFDTSNAVMLVLANADGNSPTMSAIGTTADAVDDFGSINISDAKDTLPPTEVHSLFQTDGIALRMVAPVSWGQVRPGVFVLTGVAW